MKPNPAPQVRCRFAPSPTGYLHVGGARTALFNYLFARRHKGVHVLRIEDTDQERSTQDALQAILDGLHWLNIEYDEGPFLQSDRMDLYRTYAKRLLELGCAYPCSCTTERLEQLRETQRTQGAKPQYDRLHRPQTSGPQPTTLPQKGDADPFVIRLRVPESGDTTFNDVILGEIRTANEELDDFIIIRSDGTPTYNFTVVVDDIEMRITHIIRGMDHVSNTPKQLVIYHAFQAQPPVFAHVPMILGSDKKKLSKRHGATSVFEYKKDGYLPDAFLNYLARLGWSHGDQEIFTRKELEELFTLDHIGKSPAVFDQEKLLWVNAEHMKKMPTTDLARYVGEYISEQGNANSERLNNPSFIKLVESLKERTKSLTEMAGQCRWYFTEDDKLVLDEKDRVKHLTDKASLVYVANALRGIEPFTEATLEPAIQKVIQELNLPLVKIAQPLRVALTGTAVSPPIYAVLEVLGKSRSLARLEKAVQSMG